MGLSLKESQAVNEIAKFLYDFLPGNPHPYADQSISFLGVTRDIGLYQFWRGGSKQPAIATLLEKTLDTRRDLFCKLVLEIVRRGLKYRNNKKTPITREEIKQLNELVSKVSFKIPELWDKGFLETLPTSRPNTPQDQQKVKVDLNCLKERFFEIEKLEAQARGYAFEKFLGEMFSAFSLEPNDPFRLVGEQIDGSFELEGITYLTEAKWLKSPVGSSELFTFRGKVEGKATWSRGLFISYTGFTNEGLEAFSKVGATNIIGMIGQDIYFILEGHLSLIDVIKLKVRKAAETGRILVTVHELMLNL